MATTTTTARASSTSASRRWTRGEGRRESVVRAFASEDGENAAKRSEIALADVSRGRRIGSGSFGDVFEGALANGRAVVLKEPRRGVLGMFSSERFFVAEAENNRRLRGCASVATFLGVAGANAYLVWAERRWRRRSGRRSRQSWDLHGRQMIHRDVKPNNLLIVKGGKLKLIDLGGAADLKTGRNYDEDETVFDPVYGPPERYLSGNYSGFAGVGSWAKFKPDLFDAFSCGLTILQVSVPAFRKKGGLNGVRRELKRWNYDCEAWRASLSAQRQSEYFEILDANGQAGWKLVCGLVAERDSRMSVAKALSSPFCR
ncbi:Serine/threonine-protein kinase, active site [Ostreococcus tauri]|uniref:Serine/threonine-protein kinase, active site n=1 Tax=Ostreococcus tauri TaxID=70448 RepID=Q00W08_OSTTA|nr:Serine/threonine-protein kinase, active site [Ostreococcus tauri]CAL56950.1 Serine/threonine-protein kinase, active site [Ostreococcus tauri]|eukprot:XP_003082995.1 Serine/threonine-protein kinase, active site [Ostreococcus tauri]